MAVQALTERKLTMRADVQWLGERRGSWKPRFLGSQYVPSPTPGRLAHLSTLPSVINGVAGRVSAGEPDPQEKSESPTKFSVFGYEEGCVWGAKPFKHLQT